MDAPTSLAVCAFLTQAGVIAAIILGHRHADRERREAATKVANVLEKDGKKKDAKLDEIHVLVNSRLTFALAAIAALKRKLGIDLLAEEIQAEAEAEQQGSAKQN